MSSLIGTSTIISVSDLSSTDPNSPHVQEIEVVRVGPLAIDISRCVEPNLRHTDSSLGLEHIEDYSTDVSCL